MLDRYRSLAVIAVLSIGVVLAFVAEGQPAVDSTVTHSWPKDDEGLYRVACSACHGLDGRGQPVEQVGFTEPLPDFTDCSFASREPDADWVAVAHQGGPVRGFAPMMPAFGGALDETQLAQAVNHIRTFCDDDSWPRGELNLPRPLVTEKAYPEDEWVFALGVSDGDDEAISSELIYEKRFGARNQLEVVVPFVSLDTGEARRTGLGDVAVGLKRALWHDHRRGSIWSATAEVILPTGDDDEGLGSGHVTFEPFFTFGQILPGDGFLHAQAGLELPIDDDEADDEAFWRLAAGKSFTTGGPWGRTWSPMIELLAKTALDGDEDVAWDVVPQVQVTLNTRQHVMLNAGVRVPLDDDERDVEVLLYLLWDWFDGGFFEGW